MGNGALAPTGLVSAAVLFVFVISCGGPAELVESAPPDSVVKVGVLYKSWPTSEDRELLAELGAVIDYEFQSFAAFFIYTPVAGLAVLAESDRVESISTLAAVYPGDCGP